MTDLTTKSLQLRAAMAWYTLCAATIFVLMAAGSGCNSEIVYCYGDVRDHWRHPTNVLASLAFSLFLPLPHILVALFFKTKRNFATALAIGKNWHRAVGLLFAGLLVLGLLSTQLRNATDRKLDVQSQLSDRGEALRTGTERKPGLIASRGHETALSFAIACASFKKKLGRVDDAVKINGYVLYKFSEIGTPQETAQSMIFDAVGKVNAFYADNSQNRAQVERMEAEVCSSARRQLADFPRL